MSLPGRRVACSPTRILRPTRCDAGASRRSLLPTQCEGGCSLVFLVDLRREHDDRVAFMYRHWPLTTRAYAYDAARATECAGTQGRFWEYHSKLFEDRRWINNAFVRFAVEVGVADMELFPSAYPMGDQTVASWIRFICSPVIRRDRRPHTDEHGAQSPRISYQRTDRPVCSDPTPHRRPHHSARAASRPCTLSAEGAARKEPTRRDLL